MTSPPTFFRRNMQIKKNLAKRKFYNITLDYVLIRQIKILAAQLDKYLPHCNGAV
jgi:hypothetical protein